MKKLIALTFILVLALSLVGCNKTVVIEEAVVGGDLLPQIMIDGIIYGDTGFESIVTDRKDGFDGEIISRVDQSQQPTENNQSNFGTGYGYQFGEREGTVDLYIDGRWWIYATDEAREQILHPEPTSNVNRIIGYSALYTEELINKAFDVVEEEFTEKFEGCTLMELRYDEDVEARFCTEIVKYIKENNRELIVLLSTFDTDAKGGDGSLNPDDTYTNWKWYLVRTEDMQSWEIIDWGY